MIEATAPVLKGLALAQPTHIQGSLRLSLFVFGVVLFPGSRWGIRVPVIPGALAELDWPVPDVLALHTKRRVKLTSGACTDIRAHAQLDHP